MLQSYNIPTWKDAGLSRPFRYCTLLLICLTTNMVLAQEDSETETKAEAQTETGVNTETDRLERTRTSVTRSLNYLTKKLDTFFGGHSEYEDTIGSWARINLQARGQERATAEYRTSVQIRIALPRTEGRFNIVVENNTNKEPGDGIYSSDPLIAITDPVYTGGLRYIIKHSDKWHAHADAGILFEAPIDVFIRGRLRRNYKWNRWHFQASETLTLYQSNRAHAITQMDLEYLITKKLLYRNRLSVGIRNAPEISDWALDASFIQPLDIKQAIQYQYIVRGDYDMARATDYSINFRYRRQLQRKWMFIEITPQVLYSESSNFDQTLSILFKLEMLFRKQQLD